MDIDDVKAGSRKDRDPGVGDLCEVYKFPKRKWVSIRLIPMGVFPTAQYWVKTKKKDGGKSAFPTPCPSWNAADQERDSTKYDPWQDFQEMEFQKYGKEGREKQHIQFARENWTGALIRSEQDNQPKKLPKPTKAERTSGFKEKDSDSWTPIKAVKMGASFLSQIQEMKGLNVHKTKEGKKAFAVNHVKYGVDVRVFHDPDKAPAEQYKVQIGKHTPLTEEELEYLKPNLELATRSAVPEGGKERKAFDKALKADFESWLKRSGLKFESPDEDDTDDDEDDAPKSKKGKKAEKSKSKGKKSKSDDEDDDFDDEESGDEDAEDEDDEDEDDEDEDDEDEDDEPKSKKSKSKGKKSKSDDDDDDSEDEDDDFDEDDEPKSKKSKSKGKKSKSDDDDDDDEDDDFDDEDDEDDDEPKSKKGKGKATGKKSKSKSDDEDDEDDEDEDDEDDEDEPKSRKSKAKGKSKKKSKSDDDEDDDFDDE